jgi:hypothetical protein
VGFDRDHYFLVGKNLSIGEILLLPDDFGGNRLADAFRKLVDQIWAWDFREEPIGVLVIDPFLDSFVGGLIRKEVDYPGNRKSFFFTADMEPKERPAGWEMCKIEEYPESPTWNDESVTLWWCLPRVSFLSLR